MLKHNGWYYAYGTPPHGEPLPVLRSSNLVVWEPAGQVLDSPARGRAHWAPEVAYDNGRFFLYYSTGGTEGEGHQLRVAAGDSPTGPFEESLGLLDPDDPFTIDAHPFRDDDGEWYLFYSRDFLDGERVGTGIVVDRLVDMTALAGEQATVLRPHADWHLFERQRRWYDRVWDWYTVEGPFVRKHDGRYWCFYSGGGWRAENYGISSAVADEPLGPFQPVVAADTADVLRTVPDRVIGPGHGSVAVGPDNLTEYLVYHAWDGDRTGRRMCADRLTWADGRPGSPGPSIGPQPLPPAPAFRDLFAGAAGSGPDAGRWRTRGPWLVTAGELRHPGSPEPASAVVRMVAPSLYLLEVNAAASGPGEQSQAYGAFTSYRDEENHTAVLIQPGDGKVVWRRTRAGVVEAGGSLADLRADFEAGAFHQLLLQRKGDRLHVTFDGTSVGSLPDDSPAGSAVGVGSFGTPCAFGGVTMTELDPA